MFGKVLQSLERGDGVIQAGAVQCSVDHKILKSQRKTLAHRQHGVGIILFHREHIGCCGDKAQRVKITQNDVRRDAKLLGVAVAAVGGYDHIVRRYFLRQVRKAAGTKDHTLCHPKRLLFHFFSFYHNGAKNKRLFSFNILLIHQKITGFSVQKSTLCGIENHKKLWYIFRNGIGLERIPFSVSFFKNRG